MKIQNKRARVWITLGIIGLILYVIEKFTGSFGGILVEVFIGASIFFLIIGWYIESGSRNKKKEAKTQ